MGMVRENADLVEIVGRYVELRKVGSEWEGRCPFHDERSPSFTVSPVKGFVHCFGCGIHHDVIGFLMHIAGLTFVEACEQLGARDFAPAVVKAATRQRDRGELGGLWIPVCPVPEEAPPLAAGVECSIWNPKRGRHWTFTPSRADAYRDAYGHLMGYVLRTEIKGDKITPQVTWCIGPDGSMCWALRPFWNPRPLCGLDDLAMKRVTITGGPAVRYALAAPGALVELAAGESVGGMADRPVLVVEGEKCRAAGAGALRQYAVVTWPGGSKGLRYADWSPLRDRDVVLWPDADVPGEQAMLGYCDYSGLWHDGIAQLVHAAGCKSIRYIDTRGQSKGWDIADALDSEKDGWTAKQLAAWASLRVKDVELVCAETA